MKISDLFMFGENEEPDDEVFQPPPIDRVVARLLVMRAHWCRGALEYQAEEDPEWFGSLAKLIADWMEDCEEAEPRERSLHRQPLGTWSERDRINMTWQTECATVLQWALSLYPLPAWDRKGDWVAEFDDGSNWPPVITLPPGTRLRDYETMEREAMVVETRFWRIRSGEAGDAYTLKLMDRARQVGHVELAPDGDLLCSDGRSLSQVSEGELQRMGSICSERLTALNWLTGQEVLYSQITTDTIVSWLWDENW